jgi:hypothetical protein
MLLKPPVAVAGALAGIVLLAVVADAGHTPRDGDAGSVVGLRDIARGKVPEGKMVTTTWVKVVDVRCDDCLVSHKPASIWVEDRDGHRLRTWWAKYADFNTKKQNWLPEEGWWIKVQGRTDKGDGGWFLRGKRWAEDDHPGRTVRADEVSGGKVRQGTYVWLEPVELRNKAHRADGDITWDARDARTGKGRVHLELSLPFRTDGLRAPGNGEVVRPYGFVWYDKALGWWELHPVRCWDRDECAPVVADRVRNAP